jgi:hypothetical protein
MAIANQMRRRMTLAIWVVALAMFALLVAAGFYSLLR